MPEVGREKLGDQGPIKGSPETGTWTQDKDGVYVFEENTAEFKSLDLKKEIEEAQTFEILLGALKAHGRKNAAKTIEALRVSVKKLKAIVSKEQIMNVIYSGELFKKKALKLAPEDVDAAFKYRLKVLFEDEVNVE